MQRLIAACDEIGERTGRVFAWLVPPITLLIAYEVVSRRLFRAPHTWFFEITTLLYAVHFMLVSAYALKHHSHVTVDLIYTRLTPRGRAVVDAVSYPLFFFPFFAVLFLAGLESAIDSWRFGETTHTAGLPIVVPTFKSVIPAASLLMLLQGLAHFGRSLLVLLRREGS